MSPTFFATIVAHTAAALLTGVIFAALARASRDAFLREWSKSWFALAVGLVGATAWEWMRFFRQDVEILTASLIVAVVTGVALYLHLAWILTGVARLKHDERRARTPLLLRPVGARLIVGAAVVIGAGTYLAAALVRDPAVVTLLRGVVRGLIAGVVFLSVAVRIWRYRGGTRGVGQRLVAGAAALIGLDQFLEAVLPLRFVTEMVPNMPSDVDVGFIEFGLTFAIGLSVVIWRLEEERRATRDYAARLEALALSDDVTGLPNRQVLSDRLAVALLRARREGIGLAVCRVTARRGTAEGGQADEQLVRVVAQRLSGALREVDTVARLEDGGFAVLVPAVREPEDAMQVVRRGLEALHRSSELDGFDVPLTVRCGVALYPDDGETPDALLAAADAALAEAEDDRFRFAGAGAHARAVERLSLERSLRYALGNGELAIRYQPVVGTATGRVEVVEASVHWRHPVRGVMPPESFLPAAEGAGMAAPIGEWAVHAVCAHLREWRLKQPGLRAAMPLSVRLLRHEGFVSFLAGALAASGLPPAALEFVVREGDLSHDDEHAAAMLRELRRTGHPVVVERFGAGAASLALLIALPADVVKLAPELLHETAPRASLTPNQPTLRAYAAAAAALDVRVVASGVASESELETAAMHGCQAWQGPLCSEPVPAQETGGLLERSWKAVAVKTV